MKTVKLGDVCDFQSGLWKGKKPPFVNVGVIRNTNFRRDGRLDFSNIAQLDVEAKQFGKRKLIPGDIIIEKSGGGPKQPVGRVVLFNESKGNFSFSNFTSVIRPKDKGEIYSVYLLKFLDYLYMTGITEKLQNQSTGIRNLRFEDYKKIEVPLPLIEEQRRVVKKLDEAFEKIDKAIELTKKNLQNSQDLFKSELESIFRAEDLTRLEKPVGSLCKTSAGGTPLKAHTEYYENGNIPWLRSGEVNKKDIKQTELYITEKGLKNSSAKLFSKNTVVIAMYGATAGQVGILRFQSTTNQAVCGILPNAKFAPEFIYYSFLARKADLVKEARGGAQPNVSQIKVKNTRIPDIPPVEQKRIIEKLEILSEQTQKLQKLYQQKLDDLQELKQSLLKQAFEGKL